MSTVLFCWELGAGLGHMLPMRQIASALAANGHKVHLALRDVAAASAVFPDMADSLIQAPFRHSRPGRFGHTPSFAHVLDNIGFGDDGELLCLHSAWRNLIESVRPDLMYCDHSPTALLAARCFPRVKRVVGGLGFFCPPDLSPWPPLAANPVDPSVLEAHEAGLLARINRLLGRCGCISLSRLGQLYGEVEVTLLQTFEELDHYANQGLPPGAYRGRPAGTRYRGPVHVPGGSPPGWPSGDGPRVYAYLKNCPHLTAVVDALVELRCRSIVFVDALPDALRRRLTSPLVRLETRRLDLARVGIECDFAVHNANHGTLCQLLLAGKPMLQVPLTLEQNVLARAVTRIGAAETVRGPDLGAAQVRARLQLLLTECSYRKRAEKFARRYAGFTPGLEASRMVSEVEALLSHAEPTPVAPSSGTAGTCCAGTE